MNLLLERALEVLNISNINIKEGLANPDEKDKAKDIFKGLHGYGVILLKREIADWAKENGWSEHHADELGSLAQQIGEGKQVIIRGGPYWQGNIIENLASLIGPNYDFIRGGPYWQDNIIGLVSPIRPNCDF